MVQEGNPEQLRDFAKALAKEWAAPIENHRDRAVPHLRDYWRERAKEPRKAFVEGVTAVKDGFLHWECVEPLFLDSLAGWAKDAKTHRIEAAAIEGHAQIVDPLRESLRSGLAAYNALNAGP